MYPQFQRYHAQGFDKGVRDIELVTCMTANAMFLGEHETLDDMFTQWYWSILKALHISPQFMRDTFQQWRAALKAHLSEEAFLLMRPYAEHMSEKLSDLPVPVRDESGPREPAVN